jgi:hypothetical protein
MFSNDNNTACCFTFLDVLLVLSLLNVAAAAAKALCPLCMASNFPNATITSALSRPAFRFILSMPSSLSSPSSFTASKSEDAGADDDEVDFPENTLVVLAPLLKVLVVFLFE